MVGAWEGRGESFGVVNWMTESGGERHVGSALEIRSLFLTLELILPIFYPEKIFTGFLSAGFANIEKIKYVINYMKGMLFKRCR